MKYDELSGYAESVAQLSSREEVERVVGATLETIRERIGGEQAFSLQEFITRVSKKEGVEPTVGAIHLCIYSLARCC